jgi:uncharacterized protein (TIGR03382 family)
VASGVGAAAPDRASLGKMRAPLPLALVLLISSAAVAAPLAILEVRQDRPTLHSLGVQVLISGDEQRQARIELRYRKVGEPLWLQGPPLFRVWPETVGVTIPEQFAGSLFDLEPGTAYELELRALDPETASPQVRTLTSSTRPVPVREPANPRTVNVGTAAQLRTALSAARAGDVILLAEGTYAGPFVLNASGTAQDPIVVRGASAQGVVLDGANCTCNVLEVYGSYVHVERLTLQNAIRGLRFLGTGAQGNVARRLVVRDVVHAIGGNAGQLDSYICDNDLVGRLVWPWTFASNAVSHWDDRGVQIHGDGHVVCHNRMRGFGDPVVNKTSRSRSWDVYGNDIHDGYDGTELDEGEGNLRLYRNRWTNVMVPVSLQPIFGGPAYVLRNVVFNAPDEQIKLKSLGGTLEPSGALIHHNTFVSPTRALNLQTPITQHNFVISNNLFVGPQVLGGSRVVDWTANLNGGVFDFNGYFPDGAFWFGKVAGQNQLFSSFAAAQASGKVEGNGVLLSRPIFAVDFVGPVDPQTQHPSPSFVLAEGSQALERGEALPGFNALHLGAGPDLGAVELGCPEPTYGPRPEGTEHLPTRIDCVPQGTSAQDGGTVPPPVDGGTEQSDGGTPEGDGGSAGPNDGGTQGPPDPSAPRVSGGCDCSSGGGGAAAAGLMVLLGWGLRRRALRVSRP